MPRPLLELRHASPADLADCRAILRDGSRTFFAASLLLPRRVRDPAIALYAFCRLADDAIDLGGGRVDSVLALRERLARAYEGRPAPFAVDRALADVVAGLGIPQAIPAALLEGLEWDARGHRYEDLAALYAYAARVAGTVGAMMAIVMGARDPDEIARACDLGIAMQLSNIARDVGEDARAGRLYLPQQWLREAGIDPDRWLAAPRFDAALGTVVQRLLSAADALYARADVGIGRLPASCRPAIYAARHLYAEIGREVERAGLDSLTRRAVVPAPRKARLLVGALALAVLPGAAISRPPLEETRFLIDAMRQAPLVRQRGDALAENAIPWWKLEDQLAWVIDLFVKLERREQLGQSESEA